MSPIASLGEACPAFDFESGDLYVWGNNKYGQLGTGILTSQTTTLNSKLCTKYTQNHTT